MRTSLKSRAIRACVPTWSTCQRACVPARFTCQRSCVPKACKLLIFTCQRVIQRPNVLTWRASFSTWCINVPKGVPIFQAFLLRNAKWNFYTLLLYRKFYILLDIIIIRIICICVVNKNCIILHFHTSCHVKEKCVEYFLFSYFFLFCSLVRN